MKQNRLVSCLPFFVFNCQGSRHHPAGQADKVLLAENHRHRVYGVGLRPDGHLRQVLRPNTGKALRNAQRPFHAVNGVNKYPGLLRPAPCRAQTQHIRQLRQRLADRISFSGYPLRGFIYALGFLLPVNGPINSFMLIWPDILSSSNWFYVRLDCFLVVACRIHKIPSCPKVPVPVLILQVRMPIKYHQAALSFQVSHNLGYAVLRQDAYQHMDVLFLYSNSETFSCLLFPSP